MSLGKIASSRGQRGGISLHKNLLVANVLSKARTIFMLETYNNMKSNRRVEQLDSHETDMQYADNNKESSESEESSPIAGNSEAQNGGEFQSKQQQQSCMYAKTVNNGENKENSPPDSNTEPRDICEDEVSKKSSVDSNCVRCRKRRLTEDDVHVNSDVNRENDEVHRSNSDVHSGDSHIPQKKRSKTDSESSEPCQIERTVEKMQTETTQMTSLVNSFSSGFTGLLNTDSCHNTSADQGYSSAEEDDEEEEEDEVFTSLTSQCLKSENSLISCSTQIKEAFETLARPCIALTV